MQEENEGGTEIMREEMITSYTPISNVAANIAIAAERIAASWRKSSAAIIETGQLLNEADRNFTDEDYQTLRDYLITEVGISASVISKLKTIARNPILLDPHYQVRLPPSYATLYQISKIERNALIDAINDGEITPITQLKDITSKFGSMVTRSRKKSSATSISVSLSGSVGDIDPATLEKLKVMLSELEKQVTVNVKGF